MKVTVALVKPYPFENLLLYGSRVLESVSCDLVIALRYFFNWEFHGVQENILFFVTPIQYFA